MTNTFCDTCGAVADIEIRGTARPLTQHGAQAMRTHSAEFVRNVCVKCGDTMSELTVEVSKRRSEAPERAKA